MRTDQAVYGLFSPEEHQFLERMVATYPKIGENFDRYLNAPSESRHEMMWQDMHRMKREGWLRRGVKNPESNAEHSRSAARLAVKYRPENMDIDRGRLIQMLMFHDTPEVIVTDFTPQDGISEADKHRLEKLAARAIFEGTAVEAAQDAVALIDEFIDQKTPTALWAHDADKLDAVRTALVYEATQPAQQGKLYRLFADWTKPKLKTERGREVLEYFERNQETIRNEARSEIQANKSQRQRGR